MAQAKEKDQRDKQETKYQVILVRLKKEWFMTDRRNNMLRILAQLGKDKIDRDNITDNGFSSVEIALKDEKETDRILNLPDNEERKVTYTISTEKITSRGVIGQWEQSLHELSVAIDEKDQIEEIVRLRKKVFDVKQKEYCWEATKHVLVTFIGRHIPEKISVYGGKMELTVRPFVDPVVQCFRCYKFGHQKEACHGPRICVVCGERYHGLCMKMEKCVNCGKAHKANERECSKYKEILEKNKLGAWEKKSLHNLIEEEKKDRLEDKESKGREEKSTRQTIVKGTRAIEDSIEDSYMKLDKDPSIEESERKYKEDMEALKEVADIECNNLIEWIRKTCSGKITASIKEDLGRMLDRQREMAEEKLKEETRKGLVQLKKDMLKERFLTLQEFKNDIEEIMEEVKGTMRRIGLEEEERLKTNFKKNE